MPGPPPDSVQTLGLPNRCAAEEASLGEIVVDVPDAVRRVDRVRHKLAQIVNAWHLHVPHVSEEVALVADMVLGQVQPQRMLFVVQVDQVLDIVPRAPLRLHPEESLAEHPAPHVPVVRLGAPGVVGHLRREQKRQVWLEVVALLLPELVQQLGRPRHEAGIVGFVAEKAQNGLAKLVPDRLPVSFVRDLKERAGGIRIQVVDQRILAVFGTGAVGPVRSAGRRTAEHVPDQDQLPRFRVATCAGRWRRSPPINSAGADRHSLDGAGLRKHRQCA